MKELDYRDYSGSPIVRIGLPDFVRGVFHLPDRNLDLLEIAAYVFAADRLTSRGDKIGVEYQSWSRRFHFVIRVRDYDFWKQPSVQAFLRDALKYVSGDLDFTFEFQSGHHSDPTGLFDNEHFSLRSNRKVSVSLFSGGADSLAGAVQRLEESNEELCLVSHVSQDGTARTQSQLVEALSSHYAGRVSHYRFRTNLRTIRATEESQRTRSFLFSCIAFAISTAFGQNRFYVYENGVTSMNFARRDDLLNSRASRTTHPQTIHNLVRFFSEVSGEPFVIETPFLWLTKTDVFAVMKKHGRQDLIPSTISCSHVFKGHANATHCGECFQCIDRRLGIYGADANDDDISGLYANDVITAAINSPEGKTTIVDYLRQAVKFANSNRREFYFQTLDDLQQLTDRIPGIHNEDQLVEQVYNLYSRHGTQVKSALNRIRTVHESVFDELEPDSLLEIISDREFLRAPIERLVQSIVTRMNRAIPKMFRKNVPKNENDLNDKIEGLLDAWRDELSREHPAVPFARGGVIPDFSLSRGHLLIEGKYIRGGTSPSKVNEGMSADVTKYPHEAHILFIVFDREHSIDDREVFTRDFEKTGRCTVCILP